MHDQDMRPCEWMGRSKRDLKEMPEDVKLAIGIDLNEVQYGKRPRSATPPKEVHGAGVLEIRKDFDSDTYRCVYAVRFAKAVYVLHVFQKKSKSGIATPPHDIALIRSRLREAAEHYSRKYEGTE